MQSACILTYQFEYVLKISLRLCLSDFGVCLHQLRATHCLSGGCGGVSVFLPLTLLTLVVDLHPDYQDVAKCKHFCRLHSAYTILVEERHVQASVSKCKQV